MFDIIHKKKIFFAIPVAIILVGIICFIAFGGFNLDIDFAGGTEMLIDTKAEFNKDEVTQLVTDTLGFAPNSVQQSLIQPTEVTIKTKTLSTEEAEKLWNAFKTKYNLEDADRLSTNSVSPTVGGELAQSAVLASIITVLLMLVYISFRFEFLSGVSAVVALAHDTLIILSFYAIFRLPVNTNFIACILTILGYSINNTIVVFDRIRENWKYARRERFSEVANRSIWQTMTRSINTAFTTLVTIVCLYIFGVDAIREFALALIVGMVSGTYSSIFIAAPFWDLIRGKQKADKSGKKAKA
jgi:preprotein translocase SecF subunit